jgi:titin
VFLIASPAGFNRIGGVRTEDRNVVSGNRKSGISIQTSGNLVLGNFVGTDFTGRNTLRNAEDGVSLNRSRNMIGGATRKEANVIAANGWFGVMASGNSNTILGNFIGTDPSGQVPLGNAAGGVTLGGRHSVVQANVIAYNAVSAGPGGGSGVSFSPEFDCTIRRNSIHHNAGAGIVGAAEPPAPIIKAVGSNTVAGTACPGCEVEIFSDSEDEGRVFEGSTVADKSGAFAFSKGSGRFTDLNVTATATDRTGSTSRFSAARTVPR